MANRVELFNKTMDTLIQAWIDGKLEHGDCTACAVGNICLGEGVWHYAFMTGFDSKQEKEYLSLGFPRYKSQEKAVNLIKSTGYTIPELARVEYAFESSIGHDYDRLEKTSEGQYIGLCDVLHVLMDIHQIANPTKRGALDAAAQFKGLEIKTV